MMNTTRFQVSVIIEIEQEDDDSYIVTCPQLGGIFVHEETLEAAIFYAREAIGIYIEMSIEHGDPIPEEVIFKREIITDTPKWEPITKLSLTADYTVPAVI